MSRRRARLWPAAQVLAAAIVFGAAVSGQAPSPQTARPTFRSGVNYVDVDVTVTDANGHFVSNLTRDDFEVFEDGKRQQVATFSLVDLPRDRPAPPVISGRPVREDVRSNQDAASGRVYIIVLDDLDVNPLRSALVRRSARDFITRYLGPHDLAAVVSTSGRKESSQEFTSDPALLLRAVDAFVGFRLPSAEVQRIDDYYTSQALAGLDQRTQTGKAPEEETVIPNLLTRIQDFDPSNLERGQRATGVLDTLRSLAEYLEGVPGRRKALLWFSEGIDYPMAETFSSPSGNEIIDATREAIRSAALANVNFYALDPRGLIGMTTDFIDMTKAGAPDTMGIDPNKPIGSPFSGTQALLNEMNLTQSSLEVLAEGTGGFAAVNINSFNSAFDRIVEANSRYYLLGYVPPNHARDGRFHRIEVRVTKPGVTVTSRRGYPSPGARKTATERRQDGLERWVTKNRTGGAGDTSPVLLAALNSPVQQSGLGLSMHAVPFRGSSTKDPKEASVLLTVELAGAGLEFEPSANGLVADTVELSFFALNDQGRAQKGTRSAVNLAVLPATATRLKTSGVRVNARMTAAPGRYQLRVGGAESSRGNVGTVFYDVDVPDFTRAPLMMTGLLLSSTQAVQVLTAQRDTRIDAMLGAPPSVRRTFTSAETLAVLTELYDNAASTTARRIQIRLGLQDESGRDVYASEEQIANGVGAGSQWSRLPFQASIPLARVAPGRYVLYVEAASTADVTVRARAESAITITRD
jgi:VWFA-related protein